MLSGLRRAFNTQRGLYNRLVHVWGSQALKIDGVDGVGVVSLGSGLELLELTDC